MLATFPAMGAAGPEQLVRQTVESVVDQLRANMGTFKSDPQTVYKMVDELVLPHFDFVAMTDLALGSYKDEVGTEQKPAIVSQFRQLLMRTDS